MDGSGEFPVATLHLTELLSVLSRDPGDQGVGFRVARAARGFVFADEGLKAGEDLGHEIGKGKVVNAAQLGRDPRRSRRAAKPEYRISHGLLMIPGLCPDPLEQNLTLG